MATKKRPPHPKKATRTAAKARPAQGSEAPAPPLSEAVRTALGIAANEVFVENVEAAVRRPERLLDSHHLGEHYVGYHRGMLTEKLAARRLRELSPWLDEQFVTKVLDQAKGDSAVDFAADLYDEVLLAAAVDLADGIIRLALGREREVSPRARPHLAHLRPLAARLAAKIESKDIEEWDATEEIFGKGR